MDLLQFRRTKPSRQKKKDRARIEGGPTSAAISAARPCRGAVRSLAARGRPLQPYQPNIQFKGRGSVRVAPPGTFTCPSSTVVPVGRPRVKANEAARRRRRLGAIQKLAGGHQEQIRFLSSSDRPFLPR
jgi:hypothetical protein